MVCNTASKPRLGLPNLGLGVGLRNKHMSYIMQHGAGVDWFEAISENYMDNHGYTRYVLNQLAERVPIVLHGVSLSIGSCDPLNFAYLSQLKQLAKEVNARWISDHLCWTGISSVNSHDLLPMPLTEESFAYVVQRVRIVQDFLEQPLILENPSSYVQFAESSLFEWEFLGQLAIETGCGILLDVNNVFVSSSHHGFDAEFYIKSLPCQYIVQIHIAGPSDNGGLLIDTHDHPVPSQVWQLYALAQQLTGGVSTLLEWDANIPDYPQLLNELHKAREVLSGKMPDIRVKVANNKNTHSISTPIDFQLELMDVE
ncbi:MNIO family bufferin maturase [Spartinivicinus ruber]|uniref:MNIO family bufferin maturase n=1 Tax=Spartinivicinus ruber TaxID=2683272 RepID=UPI0013D82511|nr:DUF692 domain-containing protein [Spartinivicinus ruber]